MEKPDIETNIDAKIERLKKKKAKVQNQKAVLFMKEAKQIFQDDFNPGVALAVLSDWAGATEAKKKEWIARSHSFRPKQAQRAKRKAAPREPAATQT